MSEYDMESEIRDWDVEDLSNIGALLGLKDSNSADVDRILDSIKWLYHSRARAKLETSIGEIRRKWFGGGTGETPPETLDETRPMPIYEELVRGAAENLGAYEGMPSLETCELYLSHAVLTKALERMKPSERLAFFSREIDLPKVAGAAGISSNSVAGPATTMAALGAAQASGFGVYLAATTALGFTTNAIGVTLPFAAYTGLSSTIAFVIGPAGWLAAGLWGAWKVTQAEWKTLVPVVLYIASARARYQLRALPLP